MEDISQDLEVSTDQTVSEEENIKEVEGQYVPEGSQKRRTFYPEGEISAYTKMLDFISWVKPVAFQVEYGKDLKGEYVVQIIYVR